MKLANKLLLLLEMPREKSKMTKELNALKSNIVNEILKIMYFGKNHQPGNIKHWLNKLNGWIEILSTNNTGKGPALNYEELQLLNIFKKEISLEKVIKRFSSLTAKKAYPKVTVKKGDIEDINKSIKSLVKAIITKDPLTQLDIKLLDK